MKNAVIQLKGRYKTVWICPYCHSAWSNHPQSISQCSSCSALVQMHDMLMVLSQRLPVVADYNKTSVQCDGHNSRRQKCLLPTDGLTSAVLVARAQMLNLGRQVFQMAS